MEETHLGRLTRGEERCGKGNSHVCRRRLENKNEEGGKERGGVSNGKKESDWLFILGFSSLHPLRNLEL